MAITSTTSVILLVATLLSVGLAAHAATVGAGNPPGIVLEACKNASKYPYPKLDKPGPTVDFCVSALMSHNATAAATTYGELALVGLDVLEANATGTMSKIGRMIRDGSIAMASALKLCQSHYEQVLRKDLPACRSFLGDRLYGDAPWCFFSATEWARLCDDLSRPEGGGPSPLAKENGDVLKLTNIANSLAELALLEAYH